ncbi:MAG: hypothetical protein ACRDYD_00375, partial [Acidimicrobiales bacterium]
MGKRRGGAGVERRQWGWPVLATASAAGPEVALWRAEPDPVEGLPPEPVMGSLAAVVAAPCDVLPGPVAVSEVLARPSDVLPDGLDPLPGTSTGAPRRSSSSSCSVALDE